MPQSFCARTVGWQVSIATLHFYRRSLQLICLHYAIAIHRCTLTPKNGADSLGWVPKFTPDHILEAAEAEVELILKYI